MRAKSTDCRWRGFFSSLFLPWLSSISVLVKHEATTNQIIYNEDGRWVEQEKSNKKACQWWWKENYYNISATGTWGQQHKKLWNMARVELNRNNKDEEIMVWNETVPSAHKRLGRNESGKTERVLSKMCGFTNKLEKDSQLWCCMRSISTRILILIWWCWKEKE